MGGGARSGGSFQQQSRAEHTRVSPMTIINAGRGTRLQGPARVQPLVNPRASTLLQASIRVHVLPHHVTPHIDMPLIRYTPESLQPHRSDSKNPATTCKGLCASGRPCRRSLGLSSKALADPFHASGFSDGRTTRTADDTVQSFCWQHKDQAQPVTVSSPCRPLRRTSVDTLVDRLGNVSLKDAPASGTKEFQQDTKPLANNSTRKPVCSSTHHTQASQSRRRPGFWAALCCIPEKDDDDYLEVVRHKARIHDVYLRDENETTVMTSQSASSPWISGGLRNSSNGSPSIQRPPRLTHTSQTEVQSLHLTPAVRAALDKERSKPISPSDADGYIYMFWLTDSHSAVPSPNAISSALSPSPSPTQTHTSDTLPAPSSGKSILLKIGRTSNVHRRMNEWSRQCNYDLTLVRFYPYVPGVATGSSSTHIRQVPFSRRVERLIHLELTEQRAKRGKCSVCLKEHREWFEVDASRQGLRDVDTVIRKWVKWAEDSRRT